MELSEANGSPAPTVGSPFAIGYVSRRDGSREVKPYDSRKEAFMRFAFALQSDVHSDIMLKDNERGLIICCYGDNGIATFAEAAPDVPVGTLATDLADSPAATEVPDLLNNVAEIIRKAYIGQSSSRVKARNTAEAVLAEVMRFYEAQTEAGGG